MKRILDIGHTDLRLFLKHKSAYVWLFVIPLGFVYFMGFANRGPGDPSNRKPPVLIENQDTNFLSRLFLEELGAQGMWLLNPTNQETAARGIRIPADFTSNVLQQKQTKVEFFKREGSAEADAAIIEVRLVRALIAMNGHILEAVTQTNCTRNSYRSQTSSSYGRTKSGQSELALRGAETGAIRLQLFAARQSRDVSDDEPAYFWRRRHGGGPAQRHHQAAYGSSRNAR